MGKQARLKKQRAQAHCEARDRIRLYAQVAARVLPRHFESRCCLNGTRVALEVLQHFDIAVQPAPVQAFAFNKVMYERFVAHGGPLNAATLDQWVAEGGWSVGITGEATGTWPYHLVAVAHGLLIDSSAGQFRRPQHQIDTEAVIVHPTASGFAGGRPTVLMNESGTVVHYAAVEDTTYKLTAGFRRSPWNLKVAQQVITEMVSELRSSTRLDGTE